MASAWSTCTSWRMSACDLVASPWSSSTMSLIGWPLIPPLALTESTQACSPARCDGSADGPEKSPIVPMTRAEPVAEGAADAELPDVVPPVLLVLLQAAATVATATASADTCSRLVLRDGFFTGLTPKKSTGTMTG